MPKRLSENTILAIIAALAGLAGIISLIVFWIYPTYIEKPEINIVSLPFQFGVFDSGNSNLGMTIKNVGKAHFRVCIKIDSSDKNVSILRDYDCYEFFNKGELHEPQFIINNTALFKYNPSNFTLIYSSNTGWKYTCLFIKETSNFYHGQSCTFDTSEAHKILG